MLKILMSTTARSHSVETHHAKEDGKERELGGKF